MSLERKKFTLYLQSENPADKQALEIIESIPRSVRGNFSAMYLSVVRHYKTLMVRNLNQYSDTLMRGF